MFQKLDCFGQNIFYFAVNNSKNEEIFTTLWNCIKSVLTNGEIENLLARTSSSNVFNVLHSLIIKNEKKPLEDFFKMLQNNFGTDFQKQLLSDKESKIKRNPLSIAAETANKNVLVSLWSFAKNVFNNCELNNLLTEPDKNGSNTLHLAIGMNNIEVIKYFFSIVKEQLPEDDQKNLFEKLDSFNQNIFHRAAWNSKNEAIFTTIWNCAESTLTSDGIKVMLDQKNLEGRNVLHTLLIANKPLKDFFKILLDNFDNDFQKRLLSSKEDKNGRNSLSLAVATANKSVLETLWSF